MSITLSKSCLTVCMMYFFLKCCVIFAAVVTLCTLSTNFKFCLLSTHFPNILGITEMLLGKCEMSLCSLLNEQGVLLWRVLMDSIL